ncbi:hypothetical protein JKP88DRAFT_336430 [Tribonema minus]|uniref:NACHT domain-containing protein n=1 Tax=Tribonema minus TaxID=303371 RepID=A0A835YIU6_9STRA|nr:hypothetical protein JKP88DRAFT_336430 [Tribonema minus]
MPGVGEGGVAVDSVPHDDGSAGETSYCDEHEAFAASRSSDYVYVPINDNYFATLDRHADTIEMDVKPPLVVVGEPGIGKNALLSNWEKQRAAARHKDEFVFKYFAGASTAAQRLSHMLHSLETALKQFFQLREMEVPTSEERLIWSLNRFLAAAAKRHLPTRIIVLIDGVFALRGANMPAGALHWLPMELPPGVRFIVSTVQHEALQVCTNASGGGGSALGGGGGALCTGGSGGGGGGGALREHRTYTELRRRGCPMLAVEPLPEAAQHAIITAFSDLPPRGPVLTAAQRQRIVALPMRNKPMFLRTLLYALRLDMHTGAGASALAAAAAADTDAPDGAAALAAARATEALLDAFLATSDSMALTSKLLDMCATLAGDDGEGPKVAGAVLSVLYASRDGLSDEEVMGVVLSVMYVSRDRWSDEEVMEAVLSAMYAGRDGLFDDEVYREPQQMVFGYELRENHSVGAPEMVWGAAEMVLGYELRENQRATLRLLLRVNTMVVRGRRSFSHDEFRRVVYSKYIRTPEQHVHLHTQMFRRVVYSKCIRTPEQHVHLHTQMAWYFARLPASDRRVSCLPYHLEAQYFARLPASNRRVSCLPYHLQARYFARLPASDRRVSCLPYHLEVAGAWPKLKNSLIDISMFDLWWTPQHKGQFLSFWASLTRGEGGGGGGGARRRGGSGGVDAEAGAAEWSVPPRPSYDLVEEYSRALDEYKERAHPSDARVGAVIMKIADFVLEFATIADFLLEFATLGHEEAADVPPFIHPRIPNEDLASLGVEFLSVDEEGRSVLHREDDKHATAAAAAAAGLSHAATAAAAVAPVSTTPPMEQQAQSSSAEEFPSRSTYYYHRWMWIQFPWVALANCGTSYGRGIEARAALEHPSVGGSSGKSGAADAAAKAHAKAPGAAAATSTSHSQPQQAAAAATSAAATAPATAHGKPGVLSEESAIIPAGQRAAAGVRLLLPGAAAAAAAPRRRRHGSAAAAAAAALPGGKPGDGGAEQDEGYWSRLTSAMQEEIFNYRSEVDALEQRRMQLSRALSTAENGGLELGLNAHLSRALSTAENGGLELGLNAHLSRVLSTAEDEELELGLSAHTRAGAEERIGALRAKERIGALRIKEARIEAGHKRARQLARNYRALLKMCQRHPAHSRALIAELEIKLEQDARLIQEIRRRLQGERDERAVTVAASAELRRAMLAAAALQREMLESRYRQHIVLQTTNAAAATRLSGGSGGGRGRSGGRRGGGGSGNAAGGSSSSPVPQKAAAAADEGGSAGRAQRGGGGGGAATVATELFHQATRGVAGQRGVGGVGGAGDGAAHAVALESAEAAGAEEAWACIRQATGIADPDVFVVKYLNTGRLEAQMLDLKRAGETRLCDLKAAAAAMEAELGDIRYVRLAATGAGSSGATGGGGAGGGRASRALHARLSAAQAKLRRAREVADAAEDARRCAMGGLRHVCELLGAPLPPEGGGSGGGGSGGSGGGGGGGDAEVVSMVRQLEFVLDSLMEEKDRTAQQGGVPSSARASFDTSDNQPSSMELAAAAATAAARPPEVEAALQQFSLPKMRLAPHLLSRRSSFQAATAPYAACLGGRPAAAATAAAAGSTAAAAAIAAASVPGSDDGGDTDNDDDGGDGDVDSPDGVVDRATVKLRAAKAFKAELRRLAKLHKISAATTGGA